MSNLEVVNMGDLLTQIQSSARPPLNFLPFFGREGFFIVGLSHLLSAYPKTGKTTLLVPLVLEWGKIGYTTLYCAEEPQMIWEERMLLAPQEQWEAISGVFALGCTQRELLELIRQRKESIIVIDTIRLLGIADENDNAIIHRSLVPFIAACRIKGQTLILVHHARKAGGDHGLASSGGHAFVGLVDVVLELLREGTQPRRRHIRGWGRVVEVGELSYEKTVDGKLVCLGSPQELALGVVQEKVLGIVSREWQTTEQIRAQVEYAGRSQLLMALCALAEGNYMERDPPLREGKKPGRTYRWRQVSSTTQEQEGVT